MAIKNDDVFYPFFRDVLRCIVVNVQRSIVSTEISEFEILEIREISLAPNGFRSSWETQIHFQSRRYVIYLNLISLDPSISKYTRCNLQHKLG